jgi:TolB-like protein
MITPRGQVKVLDFGLAKLEATSDRAPADALTGPQVVTGTLPYMAPEALLGEPSDERSDLFALGALLYEASTGRPPFTAKISTALVNEILNRTPTSPRAIGATLSPAFESTILRLLEKDPANRPRTASDLRTELERVALGWGPGMKPARPRIESLAVLPLENLARDPEQEYFADGMTESLISDLAKIGSLRVVSRTSALRFRGVARPLPEVARELGVDAVVEGSVLRVGDRVRITARLIEAATDRPIWSERYERDLHDVLTLQSEVAATIAEAIQG